MSQTPAQRRCRWPVWLLLACALALTLLATLYTESRVKDGERRELALIDLELAARVQGRLQGHAQVLRSAAAFFAGSVEVTRQEWQTFAQKSDIDHNLPGSQGLGFALLIPPERLAGHEQEIRAEGFPDYRVWPAGERPVYTSIVFLEPFVGRNLRAFGYDMFAEPVRRAAMERARDQDQAALSGKVLLVQETGEDVQAGALMYVPVYRAGLPTDTESERRAALVGWVYSPYRMKDLMQGILGDLLRSKLVRLAIYDGERIGPQTLLYDSRHDSPGAAEADSGAHAVAVPVAFGGHRWSLVVSPVASYAAGAAPLVLLVAGAGAAISILLAALLYALIASRHRALRLAAGLAARRRAQAALRERESMLSSMLDNIPFEFWARDAQGRMVIANPVLVRQWGQVLGTLPEDAATSAQELAQWQSNNARVMAGEVLQQEVECVVQGQRRVFQRIVAPVRQGARVRGILGFNIDITALKKAQAELEQHRDHLEALVHDRTSELAATRDLAESANRAKSAFLANISHELRTPMNQIMGLGYLLAQEVQDPRAQERLAQMARASRQLLGLIDDILEYSRSEAEQIRIESIDFDLPGLIDQAEDAIRRGADAKGLLLIRDLDPALPPRLKGDPYRLRQVLGILLGNAVKFSERGSIVLRVRRTAAHNNHCRVRFEVEDQGIGIAPEVQTGLFQLFNQGDNSSTRRYGGAGLGLALGKRLVALMAGEIGVISTPGQGSLFWFGLWLPLGEAPPLPAADPGTPNRREVEAAIAALDGLLAGCDCAAVSLWHESRHLLTPVLRERLAAFEEALTGFDLETALHLLRAAVTGRAQFASGH